jgi:hypothetical protein
MTKMKERGQIPGWCNNFCKVALSDTCIEECWPAGDTSGFVMKEGTNLEDMPRFPLKEFSEDMTPKERQLCVGVYMAKVVDAAKGVKDERDFFPYPIRSRRFKGKRSFTVFEDIQNSVVRIDSQKEDSPCESVNKKNNS